MNMYFDSPTEKAQSLAANLTTANNFFFTTGDISVEWISVKSTVEIYLMYLLFSGPTR
jgi:hypothetical protein